MSETPELLPCPFCGNAAHITHLGQDVVRVMCNVCASESAPNNRLKAIAVWNTRTPARPDGEAVAWRWYRDGVIVPITEEHARHVFDRWQVLSDDRGGAMLMIKQLWAEIDRLRAPPPPASAGVREATIEECAKIIEKYGLERLNATKDYPATIAAELVFHVNAARALAPSEEKK
jgi:hypothetical protein